MKKSLLLIILSFIVSFSSFAQSLQIENVVSNFYDPLQDAIAIKGNIRNLTGETINVLVRSDVQTMPTGSITFFCWAQCYSPAVIVSPSPLTAEPNGTITEFHGYYRDNGATGEAIVNFVFYREDNPNDSLLVSAVFDPATVGINDLTSNISTVSAFPNPANDKLTIAYKNVNFSSGASLELYNMLGVRVSNFDIRQKEGSINIPAYNLKAGVYFYVIREAGKTSKASRITIKH
ncbi:MAG: T9SS type A sorting domain-containing protein [Bacteroidia bacterium]